MLIALMGYLLPKWADLVLGISLAGLPMLTFFLWLPESPHWLKTMGKVEKANKVLRKIVEGLKYWRHHSTLFFCKFGFSFAGNGQLWDEKKCLVSNPFRSVMVHDSYSCQDL